MYKSIVLVSAMILVGCIDEPDEVDTQSDEIQEIIENLRLAGYPASEITVEDGVVIVGGDAVVTLGASREMIGLEPDGERDEEQFRQYRTYNLVGPAIETICLDGSAFKGTLSVGLDQAIDRYNALGLQFSFERTSSADAPGCDATIEMLARGWPGGIAGFPEDGLPYPTVQVGKGTAKYGLDVVRHVIIHELGHCIGLRHSDWYNRAISCGGQPDNEGEGVEGAVHIPGTPPYATEDGSIMNACFDVGSEGEFTDSDVDALTTLY